MSLCDNCPLSEPFPQVLPQTTRVTYWPLPPGNSYPNCTGNLNRNSILPRFSSPFLSQKKQIWLSSSYHNLVSVYFIPWNILKINFTVTHLAGPLLFHQQFGLNDQVEWGQRKPKQCFQNLLWIPPLMLSRMKDCISSSREGSCSHLPPSCERRAQWCCLNSAMCPPGWLLVVNRFRSSSQYMCLQRDWAPGHSWGAEIEGLLLHLSEGSCCLR